MTGAYFNDGGNGANYLCMPEEPKFVRPTPGRQAWTSYIVGMELENPLPGTFLSDNVAGGSLYNQDLLCAVCYVSDSSTQIMIPGRPDCHATGFDLQYQGFLVAEAASARKRGEYVCVDEAPEGRPGGSGNDDNGVVYTVQVGCGSLPCNPYVDGYEVPCAVCTY
jgi:hypothetical protein